MALAGLISIGVFELNVWANLGIAIVLGLCFASRFLGHEILHGTVVRKAWLRDFLGTDCIYAIINQVLNFGESGIMQRITFIHNMKRMIQMHGLHLRSLKGKFLSWVYRMPSSCTFILWFSVTNNSIYIAFDSNVLSFIKSLSHPIKNLYGFNFFCLGLFGLVYCLLWDLEKWLFAYVIPLLIANFIVTAYISQQITA